MPTEAQEYYDDIDWDQYYFDQFDKSNKDDSPPSYATFGGVQVQAIITIDKTGPIILGNLQTLSWSTNRDKTPVKVLGQTNPRSYVRGFRTYAGSFVFADFNKQSLSSLATYKYETFISPLDLISSPVPDMLPPFDIILTFHNEYGYISRMVLYGIDIIKGGQQISVNNIYSEEVLQFVCRKIDRKTRVMDPHDPSQKAIWQKDFVIEEGYYNLENMRYLINMGLDFPNTPYDYQLPGS